MSQAARVTSQAAPGTTGLHKFNKGISHLTMFTAAKMRSVMRTIVVATADVWASPEYTVLFVRFLELYGLSRKQRPTDSSWKLYQQKLALYEQSSDEVFAPVNASRCCFQKQHDLLHVSATAATPHMHGQLTVVYLLEAIG
jgi:hypothetical protein